MSNKTANTRTINIVPIQGEFTQGPMPTLINFVGPGGVTFSPTTGGLIDGATITNSTLDSSVIGGIVPAAATFSSASIVGTVYNALSFVNNSGQLSTSTKLTTNGSNLNVIGPLGVSGDITVSGAGALRGCYGFGASPTNVVIGDGAFGTSANTAGTVAVGFDALTSLTVGLQNTAVGAMSLVNNTVGSTNVAIGGSAMSANVNGGNNVGIGVSALYSNVGGGQNTACGYNAMYNVTGGNNSGLGSNSLASLTTGTNNIGIGWNSGGGLTTGSGNTVIGSQVSGLASGMTNNVIIGNGIGAIQAHHDGNNWALVGAVSTSGYKVAALPTGVIGMKTYVTDALAPVALASIVGGGGVTCPAFYNGVAWIVG